MIRTIIESPLGTRVDGSRCSPEEFEANVQFARRCVEDSLLRGEAPFASHVIYPLVLDDATPEQRRMGMEAGFEWGTVAQQIAIYVDNGITPGMAEGIQKHKDNGLPLEFRYLNEKSS
jgi:hypothetical protein